jgi:hypothetical protein
MENFQEKIKNQFAKTPIGGIQGRGRDPLKISKGNRFLGIKPNRKFLGRNRSGRNKVKSKRRNNFKTFEARKILASRHGITNALKKVENKYVLSYGDIARLMRQNNYVYNTEVRRWLTKSEKDKEDADEKQKKANQKEPAKKDTVSHISRSDDEIDNTDDSEDDSDKEDPILSKPNPFKFTPPEKKKPEKKDRLKTLQARIILIANGEQSYGDYSIEPDDIDFTIPDEAVKERMGEKQLLWLKNKDKWVDYKGKDPNPLEHYKGTLGRAMLVNAGEYSFLDFEDGNIDMVSEKMEHLGYEYIDGDWVYTEEEAALTEEAAGTSSTPTNAGPGANSQGIAPFRARLGSKMKKRTFPETTAI